MFCKTAKLIYHTLQDSYELYLMNNLQKRVYIFFQVMEHDAKDQIHDRRRFVG